MFILLFRNFYLDTFRSKLACCVVALWNSKYILDLLQKSVREEGGAKAAAFAASHFQGREAWPRNIYPRQSLGVSGGSGTSPLRCVASNRAVHKL